MFEKSKKKILLLENDTMLREAICTILETEAFLVYGRTLDECSPTLQEKNPDIVIIDIPYKHVLPEIRKAVFTIRRYKKHMPILLSSTDPQVKEIMTNLDVDDFLEAPFDLQEFLKRIIRLS